jgi:hypothetical protein
LTILQKIQSAASMDYPLSPLAKRLGHGPAQRLGSSYKKGKAFFQVA